MVSWMVLVSAVHATIWNIRRGPKWSLIRNSFFDAARFTKNCFCVAFILRDFAPVQAEVKHGFRRFGGCARFGGPALGGQRKMGQRQPRWETGRESNALLQACAKDARLPTITILPAGFAHFVPRSSFGSHRPAWANLHRLRHGRDRRHHVGQPRRSFVAARFATLDRTQDDPA